MSVRSHTLVHSSTWNALPEALYALADLAKIHKTAKNTLSQSAFNFQPLDLTLNSLRTTCSDFQRHFIIAFFPVSSVQDDINDINDISDGYISLTDRLSLSLVRVAVIAPDLLC